MTPSDTPADMPRTLPSSVRDLHTAIRSHAAAWAGARDAANKAHIAALAAEIIRLQQNEKARAGHQ